MQNRDASAAELERALAEATAVRQDDDAVLVTKETERANVVLGPGSASEIDARLEALDREIGALKRRRDIAAATEAALQDRLQTARSAEAERAKRRAYDDAAAALEEYAPREVEFLTRITKEWRALLRQRCGVSLAVRAANRALPEGAAALRDVDLLRRLPATEPEVEVREFSMLVDEAGRPFAEADTSEARALGNGKFEVRVPDGHWANGDERAIFKTCEMVSWVEVTTTTRAPTWLNGLLPSEVAIPAAQDGDAIGWNPMPEVAASEPELVLRQLDQLERAAPGSGLKERMEVRRMPAEEWQQRREKAAA